MEKNISFKSHLQNELAKRTKRNSRFSIRAFARQLGVEPSALAQILSGRRPLTDKMCMRLASKLGLSPSKINSLMRRQIVEHSPADNFRSFNRIQEDAFRVIADWQYFAILELTHLDNFQGNISWIANTLQIGTGEAHVAIERLKRLGYLQIDNDGNWKDCLGDVVNLGNEQTASAYREHQKQILKKALEAIDDVPYEERVQSSMILAGSKERVAEAKRRIVSFIEEIDEYLKGDDSHDEVYTISVSLFPTTKTSNQTTNRSKQ